MKKLKPLSFEGLSTYSIHDRVSKVSLADCARPVEPGASFTAFVASLPGQLAARDFRQLVDRLAAARRRNRPVILGMGAHVIKVGLSPVVIDLMERNLVTGIALNGAGIVHDTELAMVGRTSEEVGEVLGTGAFGAARETGAFINQAINSAVTIGLGEAIGLAILEKKLPHQNASILAAAARLGIPATVHVAVGTDIVHIHPQASGEKTGRATYHDFQLFCAMVAELEGGAYCNIGSAVLLPEIFLKALTVVRNLGHQVNDFTTANFDFIRHYRPLTNVVNRPTAVGGKGFSFTGHHEIMVPLLAAALKEAMASGGPGIP